MRTSSHGGAACDSSACCTPIVTGNSSSPTGDTVGSPAGCSTARGRSDDGSGGRGSADGDCVGRRLNAQAQWADPHVMVTQLAVCMQARGPAESASQAWRGAQNPAPRAGVNLRSQYSKFTAANVIRHGCIPLAEAIAVRHVSAAMAADCALTPGTAGSTLDDAGPSRPANAVIGMWLQCEALCSAECHANPGAAPCRTQARVTTSRHSNSIEKHKQAAGARKLLMGLGVEPGSCAAQVSLPASPATRFYEPEQAQDACHNLTTLCVEYTAPEGFCISHLHGRCSGGSLSWLGVYLSCTLPPTWSPAQAHCWPSDFRAAVRTLLLCTHRLRPSSSSSSGSSPPASSAAPLPTPEALPTTSSPSPSPSHSGHSHAGEAQRGQGGSKLGQLPQDVLHLVVEALHRQTYWDVSPGAIGWVRHGG
ncbi:hypothetical protein V8C86DRAFT_2542614 [Haematococcus lacustris]